MADAKVIGMDGRARSARTVLAGADRASGERARRRQRTTPLLPGPVDQGATRALEAQQLAEDPSPDAQDVTPAPAPAASTGSRGKQKAAGKTRATKPAVTTPLPKKPKQASPARPAGKKPVTEKPAADKAFTEKPAAVTSAAEKSAAVKPAAVKPAAVKPVAVKPTVRKAAAASRPAAEASATVIPIPAADGPLPAGGRHSVARALLAQAGEALLEAAISKARPAEVEEKVASILSFVRRRLTGDYELDEFGFDPEFAEKVPLALVKPLYKYWFRVEVRGIENVPDEGGALIVANHSGTLPMDAVMTAMAVHEAHPQHRFLRTLGADLVFQTPFLAGLARRAGATLASNPDAERLLSGGHVVGVWPEGFKGIGKPFSERYKLQRFGRGGFVSAALRTGTPIIPCSIVGAEEIYPIIADVPSLARLFGLPYVPVTPFFPLLGPLGAIPLPSKWLIEFGPPVPTNEYGPHAADDPMLVFDLTDQVRQSIQQTLYSLLVQRRSIFF